MDWFHWLNLGGVAVGAISGTLMAYQKKMDGFAVIVLAMVTAFGGGTLRDLMLDVPVFWTVNTDHIYTCLISATVVIIWLRISVRFPYHYLLYADAVGVALFNVVGLEKSLECEVPMIVAITMGTVTGVFGGLLRDVLCRKVPLVFGGELYAFTCILGGVVYALAYYAGLSANWCSSLAVVTTVSLRIAALRWHWEIPVFK